MRQTSRGISRESKLDIAGDMLSHNYHSRHSSKLPFYSRVKTPFISFGSLFSSGSTNCHTASTLSLAEQLFIWLSTTISFTCCLVCKFSVHRFAAGLLVPVPRNRDGPSSRSKAPCIPFTINVSSPITRLIVHAFGWGPGYLFPIEA